MQCGVRLDADLRWDFSSVGNSPDPLCITPMRSFLSLYTSLERMGLWYIGVTSLSSLSIVYGGRQKAGSLPNEGVVSGLQLV